MPRLAARSRPSDQEHRAARCHGRRHQGQPRRRRRRPADLPRVRHRRAGGVVDVRGGRLPADQGRVALGRRTGAFRPAAGGGPRARSRDARGAARLRPRRGDHGRAAVDRSRTCRSRPLRGRSLEGSHARAGGRSGGQVGGGDGRLASSATGCRTAGRRSRRPAMPPTSCAWCSGRRRHPRWPASWTWP